MVDVIEYYANAIEFRWGLSLAMFFSAASVFAAFMYGYGWKLLKAFVADVPASQSPQPRQAAKVICGSCGAEVSAGVQFCGNCGTAVKKEPFKCPYCKTEQSGDAPFCGNCGAKLK